MATVVSYVEKKKINDNPKKTTGKSGASHELDSSWLHVEVNGFPRKVSYMELHVLDPTAISNAFPCSGMGWGRLWSTGLVRSS